MTEPQWGNDPREMVTEKDWLNARDVLGKTAMRRHLSEHCWKAGLPPRKERLFAVACCRRIWHLLADEQSRKAVEVAERYADGEATEEELSIAAAAVTTDDLITPAGLAAQAAADAADAATFPSTHGVASKAVACSSADRTAARRAEVAAQCDILRDLYGNPFRPPRPLAPSILGPGIPLARAAYEERDLPSGHLNRHRLAVLADALEEAGADAEVVAHLRNPGPHYRGCYVVDTLCGKS